MAECLLVIEVFVRKAYKVVSDPVTLCQMLSFKAHDKALTQARLKQRASP